MTLKSKTSYTDREEGFVSTAFTLNTKDGEETQFSKIKTLDIGNFVWHEKNRIAYDSVYYVTYVKNGEDFIAISNDLDSLFLLKEVYSITDKEEPNLVFPSQDPERKSYTVPIQLTGSTSRPLFMTNTLLTGIFNLNEKNYFVTIWPFQTGVTVNITTEKYEYSRSLQIKYYKIDEQFELDNSRYKFSDYSYNNQTLTLTKIETTDTVLTGYKKGTYLENKLLADIKRKTNVDLPALFYFGAKWCLPCQAEIKKIPQLAIVLEKRDINLVTVISQHKETKQELEEYVQSKGIKTPVIIEPGKDQAEIIPALQVSTYPSYIFINEKGEIIYRSDYREKKLREFLEILFKK